MHIQRMLLGGLFILLVLSGCGGEPAATPTAEATGTPFFTPTPTTIADAVAALEGLPIADFFDQAFQMVLARDPEWMLALGLVSDPEAPLVLTDFSLAYQQETAGFYLALLDVLYTYQYASLEPDEQVSYRTFEWFLREGVQKNAYADLEYLVSPMATFSYPQMFLSFFTERHPLNTPADAAGYVARIHLLDEKVETLVDRMETRIEGGFIEPFTVIEYAYFGIKYALGETPSTSPLYTVFLSKTAEMDNLEEPVRTALTDELILALEEEVFPAFNRLEELLLSLQTEASLENGLSAFAGGEDYYNWLLHFYTTTWLNADEAHVLGLQEMERITKEIIDRFDALGYDTHQDLSMLFQQLAEESGVLNEEAIVPVYERVLAQAAELVGDDFDLHPAGALEVVGGLAGTFYSPGSWDGTRPGRLFVYTGDAQMLYRIKTAAYHGGIPGRHLQATWPIQRDLPFFRQVVRFHGYGEGWGMYAEYLAWEAGWYADDPAGDLGRLQNELLRAVRLVVDTGIHVRGWHFADAMQYVVKHTGLSAGEAYNEVVRYIGSPGEVSAYAVGKVELLRMRAEAQEAQGDAFDLRQFHAIVLENGSLPLPVLEEVIENWTAEVLDN